VAYFYGELYPDKPKNAAHQIANIRKAFGTNKALITAGKSILHRYTHIALASRQTLLS